MRSLILLGSCVAACFATGVEPVREVTYAYADELLPTFDKGYLLSVERPGTLAVYGPDGLQAFRKTLMSPEGRPCSVMSAAIDTDRTIAVSVSFRDSQSRAGIYLLDLRGEKVRFIDTNRYLPSFVTFDREHFVWSLGWQKDEFRTDYADSQDHNIVRKYSRSGQEIGSFLPRSQWKLKLEPGAAIGGYWHIATAGDRIGAIMYENTENQAEWVEWDLQGKLLSRTVLNENLRGGRAYTSDGKLYARILTRASGQQRRLSVLDTKTGKWSAVSTGLPRDAGLLLGADGKHLVFLTGMNYRLLWVAVE